MSIKKILQTNPLVKLVMWGTSTAFAPCSSSLSLVDPVFRAVHVKHIIVIMIIIISSIHIGLSVAFGCDNLY